MNNSDYDPEARESFYERYNHYSDHQIKTILKNHKDYQEAAVTAAIKIAIERELIHSDQDLMAPEYQNDKAPGKITAFPEIPDALQHKKIVGSIFRILFLVSFIPLIFGIMKFAEGELKMTYMGFGLGLLWLGLTLALQRTRNLIIIFLQILLLLPIVAAIGYRMMNQGKLPATDIVVLFILTALIIYLLLYLRKLFLTKPEQLPGQ